MKIKILSCFIVFSLFSFQLSAFGYHRDTGLTFWRSSQAVSGSVEASQECAENENETYSVLNNKNSHTVTEAVRENDVAALRDITRGWSSQEKERKLNRRITWGMSPLHIAVIKGNLEIVKYLLSIEEVDINKKTNLGKTALDLALKKNNSVIASILFRNGGTSYFNH